MTPEMRTRSPAFSACTSASESGVWTSLMPSEAVLTLTASLPCVVHSSSQRRFLVAMRVAFDGDGDGQRRDVTWVREDVDSERGRVASVALRPDAETVGAREQLLLEPVQRGVRIRRAELAEQGFLRKDRRLLERTADADTEDQRRARVGPRRLHALDHEILHTRQAGRRRQHRVLRPVLAAAAF